MLIAILGPWLIAAVFLGDVVAETKETDRAKYARLLFPKGPGKRKSHWHDNTLQPARYLFLDEAAIGTSGVRLVAYTLQIDPIYPGGDGQFWPGLAVVSQNRARVLSRENLVGDLKHGTEVPNDGADLSIQITPFLIGDTNIARVQVTKRISGQGSHTWGLDLFFVVTAEGHLSRALSAEQGMVYGKYARCMASGLNLRWWSQDTDGDGVPEIVRRTRNYSSIESDEECRDEEKGPVRWRAYRLSAGVFARLPSLPRSFRISRTAVDLGGIWLHEKARVRR